MLRDPKTLRDTDTLIEDPVLEPFFISSSSIGGYTVYERVIKGKDDKPYLRTVSYPSTFNHALKIVAKEKLNSNSSKAVYSLREYVTKWEEITKAIETATLMPL
jgi:hypothetical protein